MDIAGLSYHIDGECWICDDDRMYHPLNRGHECRITLFSKERTLFHRPSSKSNEVSLARYIYVRLYGYTSFQVRHTCNISECVNPDHLYESTPSTRRQGTTRGATLCYACFNLLRNGQTVRCCAEAYKNGEPFPLEDAFKNRGRIRPHCPFYDIEEEESCSGRMYRRLREDVLEPTLFP